MPSRVNRRYRPAPVFQTLPIERQDATRHFPGLGILTKMPHSAFSSQHSRPSSGIRGGGECHPRLARARESGNHEPLRRDHHPDQASRLGKVHGARNRR
jgi:hypothetical protein